MVNKVITMYLRCLKGEKPREWIRWLPWAKFCYNTSYQTPIRTTPFKLVYGRDPPQWKTYSPGETTIQSVDDMLTERDNILVKTKLRLQQSQDYYTKHYTETCSPDLPDRRLGVAQINGPIGSSHLHPPKRQVGSQILRPISNQ